MLIVNPKIEVLCLINRIYIIRISLFGVRMTRLGIFVYTKVPRD